MIPTRRLQIASAPRVRRPAAVLPGGFRVFDTPLEPKHTTRERIAQAVADY
jgi:hypothetical protein